MDTKALYAAETLEDGVAVLLKPMPAWVPLTSAITASALYYGSYRFRLLMSKVRHIQLAKIQRRQAEEAQIADALMLSQQLEASQKQQRDLLYKARDASSGDPTEVSDEDVNEFCMSLGILQPRDADLKLRIEQMIHGDPIPDGFALVRTSGGYVRYQNQQTEELTFFYSQALAREIRETVKSRNQAHYAAFFADRVDVRKEDSMEEKKNDSFARRNLQNSSMGPSLRHINWEEEDDKTKCDDGESGSGWKAFHSVLGWFVERERAKLEAEAAAAAAEKKHKKAQSSMQVSAAMTSSTLRKARARVSMSFGPSQPPLPQQQQPLPSSSSSPSGAVPLATTAAPPLAPAPASPNKTTAAGRPPIAAAVGSSNTTTNDEDSTVLNRAGSMSNQEAGNYTPAGLPPVPKRIPTQRSSRQSSPTNAAAAAASGTSTPLLERSMSGSMNGGGLPRTPTWRAKSPALPPPQQL